MYARKVESEESPLTFAVSGMLWRRSLVMVDQQTGSLWSHLLGKAMRGPLEGVQLETLPAQLTTWKAWKKAYPDSTVLAMTRTGREFVRDFHLTPDRFVLGIRNSQHARAYPFELLRSRPWIEDLFDGEPILVLYESEGTGGRVFSRRLDGRTLTFSPEQGLFRDRETQTLWDRQGRAVDGPEKGQVLQELPAIPSFVEAWKAFYPDTVIVEEDSLSASNRGFAREPQDDSP